MIENKVMTRAAMLARARAEREACKRWAETASPQELADLRKWKEDTDPAFLQLAKDIERMQGY